MNWDNGMIVAEGKVPLKPVAEFYLLIHDE
jgi:hypothetical protein